MQFLSPAQEGSDVEAAMRPQRGQVRIVKKMLGALALVAVVLLLTLLRPDYELLRYAKAVSYAVSILGLSVVIGFSGQFSLAQGAFTGLGAYTAAILVHDHAWPLLATFPIAGIIGFAAGCLLGLPALRIKGHYLATMTLGVAIVFPIIVKRYADFTGGANGKLAIVNLEAPFGLPLTTDQWRFLVICAVGLLCFVFVRNLRESRVGRAMALIRANESGALSNGINVKGYRVLAFGYAGLFGALAGPMLVMVLGIVGPDDYSLTLAILLIAGLVVGGANTLMGPLLGGVVVAFLPTVSANVVNGPQSTMLYAVVLIGIIFLLPGGLASLPGVIRSRWRRGQLSRQSRVEPTAHPNPIEGKP